MKSGFHSRTAEVTAAIRASHFLYDEPQLFSDPFAIDLTSPSWRLICQNRILHWLIIRKKFGLLRPVHGWILARSFIAESRLMEFVEGGGKQYVQVGAGFDSMSLRNPPWLSNVKLFELDHPDTQSLKWERINKNNYCIAKNLELVPVDLEQESIATSLARSSFDRNTLTFFSWLGVVYYLSETTITTTLQSIAASAKTGSEVVFDYLVPEEYVDSKHREVYVSTRAYTAKLGEPYISFHSPK